MNDKNDIDVKKNAAALTLKNVSFSYKNTRVITDFPFPLLPEVLRLFLVLPVAERRRF